MGIINDAINTATKQARETIDDFESYVVHTNSWIEEKAGQIEKGLRDADRQINFDEREAISGEAKALSPLQFLQFTPVKVVGVTRLPVTGAKAVGWVVRNRNVFINPIKTSKSWIEKQSKQLPELKPNMNGRLKNLKVSIPNRVRQTVKEITPKNPRTKGMTTGVGLSLLVTKGKDIAETIGSGIATNGQSKRNEDLEHEGFILSRKVSRERWV